MRRVFAFVILAVFMAGPASRIECLLACATVEATERTVSCHSGKSLDPVVSAGSSHCVSDALPVAVAATRGEVQSHQSGLTPADDPTAATPRAAHGDVVRPQASPTPPLTAFLVPLRI